MSVESMMALGMHEPNSEQHRELLTRAHKECVRAVIRTRYEGDFAGYVWSVSALGCSIGEKIEGCSTTSHYWRNIVAVGVESPCPPESSMSH